MTQSRFDFLAWCEKQDPATVPFRNGAPHTTPFGLRTSQEVIDKGGFPGHTANDRGAGDRSIAQPFPGGWFWKHVGGQAGTLLQMIPEDKAPVELQVFHTSRRDGSLDATSGVAGCGDVLPVLCDKLGFSRGRHTHAMLITTYHQQTRDAIAKHVGVTYYADETFNDDEIRAHCLKHGLTYPTVRSKLEAQVSAWGIVELHDRYSVHTFVPGYRTPHWGAGAVIYVDSRWALQI